MQTLFRSIIYDRKFYETFIVCALEVSHFVHEQHGDLIYQYLLLNMVGGHRY